MSKNFVVHPKKKLEAQGKTMCAFCESCTKNRLAKVDGPVSKSTGMNLYRKGDFIIECDGMPEKDEYIPNQKTVIERLEQKVGRKLTAEELENIRATYDPVLWAYKYLGWEPRSSSTGEEYHKNILNCSAKRKVLRCGRRLGKSEALIVLALYKLFTNSPHVKRYNRQTGKMEKGFSTIMFVAPFLSQVKDFFSRLRDFIYNNPDLKAEVKTDVSTPFFKLELKSGMKILGFSAGSSGASSLRGQKADIIILDEVDYLDQDSLDTIMALLMEHADVELIAASTPSGRREYFYDWCENNMEFKEFYYPSMANPNWGDKMEAELRGLYRTEIAWKHEIEADFGEAASSVFQYKYLENAMERYEYQDCVRHEFSKYAIGCDWNDAENGTKIRVMEYNPGTRTIRAVDVVSVEKAGWNQTAAIEAIIRMNRKWKADYVYVDAGYGAMQIEHLRKYGHEARFRNDQWSHVDMTLMETKGINFSSKHATYDPISGLPEKQPMKPFMVESCVRKFEAGTIKFPMSDEILLKQLHGYNVAKISANGTPVYESGPAGDHDLDALMLACLAFEIELSEYSNPTHSSHISFSGRIGEEDSMKRSNDVLPYFEFEQKPTAEEGRKPEIRSDFQQSTVSRIAGYGQISTTRTYTWEAFNSDDRHKPVARVNPIERLRRGQPGSRRIF